MRVFAGAFVAGVVAVLLVSFGPKAKYTLDGYDYAIAMLMDRGASYSQAVRETESFYACQPIAKMPLYARWLHGKPEYWELFSVRRVYPALSSLLYGYRGFEALADVSRLSYVVVAVLVVVLCARFAPVPYGVLLSFGLDLFPLWRDLSRTALTDALAVALTTAALIAALGYVRRGSSWLIAALVVLCGALTFTRPISYIVAGAATCVMVAALAQRNRQTALRAALIAVISIAWSAAAAFALQRAHAQGLAWIVADAYRHFVGAGYAVPGESLTRWYASEELQIAWLAIRDAALFVVPLLALAGILLERRRSETILLAGACAATWLGALVDPDRFDMVRCVALPVAPAVAALASAALRRLAALVPRSLGPAAHAVRYAVPIRSSLRKDTVKEQ
jgi:4-amino-4-deoxy-L-arabinose transferase-like glycosyltransferase